MVQSNRCGKRKTTQNLDLNSGLQFQETVPRYQQFPFKIGMEAGIEPPNAVDHREERIRKTKYTIYEETSSPTAPPHVN